MSDKHNGGLHIRGNMTGAAIVGSAGPNAVVAGQNASFRTLSTSDGNTTALQELLAAVAELRADLARFADTPELRELRSDLDTVETAGLPSVPPGRDALVRLQSRITAMNAGLAGLLSATAVAEAIGRLLG